MNSVERAAFIWSLAELLRGDYKAADYGKVILPLTVLRRLDCASGGRMFAALHKDPGVFPQLLNGLETVQREIVDCFDLRDQLPRLRGAGILEALIERFSLVDLHPDVVSNHEMGAIFEELVRRFSEQTGPAGGEHFTPREVIRLMVELLLQDPAGSGGATVYDPACGTGGMLSTAAEHLRERDPGARVEVFGQEINRESYAICKADLLLKGGDPDRVRLGNTLLDDAFSGERFDYLLSNPPFGVEWKKAEKAVRAEQERMGYTGRFGAGLPRVSDGSLLFLQHMLSKMKPEGSRLAVVFNASPLFAGDAGSGESEIRRWILDNDWLEAIVALPDQLFYNTGLATYIWILSNRKRPARQGKVQLVNAVGFFRKMRRSVGAKRHEISAEHIGAIVDLYGGFREGPHSRILENEEFLYRRIIVERPLRLNFQASPQRIDRANGSFGSGVEGLLRGMDGAVYRDQTAFEEALAARFRAAGVRLGRGLRKQILRALSERDPAAGIFRPTHGGPEPDTDLRDSENVPFREGIRAWFEREVQPHAPDAWMDEDKTRIGCEIPFTRLFFEPRTLRGPEEISAEIRGLGAEIRCLLERLTE